jgi:hypothetical protein
MAIAKLIRSSEGRKSNPAGKWYVHDQIKPFIQGIEVGQIDLSQVSSTLISGVPTPWARPKLFWFAFDYLQRQDANIQTSGLIEFYRLLIDEWKGLIALVALYPGRVSFSDPVFMDVSNSDIYEISGAFGRMLMEDTDLWINQKNKLSNPDEKPFIQLLKYNNQVIGGSSPFSIVFSGVDYSKLKNAGDIKWFRNGKFEDPTKYLDKDKFQKLYLFIKNINNNFREYEDLINSFRPNQNLDLSGVKNYLREWQREIERTVKALEPNGTVAKYGNLSMPFKGLLASEQKVFQKTNGTLTFLRPDRTELKAEINDLQTLLKDDKKIIGWYETGDGFPSLSKAPVFFLKVLDTHEPSEEDRLKYFALPLSMEGMRLFNKDLRSLLDNSNSNFSLLGSINEHNNLIVDLTVEIDGRPQKLNSKEYEIEMADSNRKVILWPNFISDHWDSYYLYSEFPLNVQGLKFVPFFKVCQKKIDDIIIDVQSIVVVNRERNNAVKEIVVYSDSNPGDIRDSGLEITNLISYPVRQVSQDMLKYDVIKSNKPIAGLEIRSENAGRTQIAGYLIVKNPDDNSMEDKKIIDLTNIAVTRQAIIGIDFGSNNTCIHYKAGNEGVKPILFKNRRLALVGKDSGDTGTAEINELLFFSNKPTTNGQIKSWLHEHDLRYIGPNRDKEIAGGVPVNEKNIQVKEMDKYKITTQAGILHHNMKWLDDPSGLSKKTAYLKAIWLSVCADLYADNCLPNELRWSFPGSMTSTDITQYNTIYNVQLPETTPILNPQANPKTRIRPSVIINQTEAESVCKYALSQNFGLTNTNLFLGIDIGGSTSDILILAKDVNEAKLFKQSSVRIAAGVFFDAITNSTSFRKAIYDYHQQQRKIKVENIREILSAGHKAPFYLNSVFDQLDQDDFALFYTYLGREASFVFALPAYVTGILLFYSGKLTAKTIADNNLTTVKEIHLLPFGKGGRLFHWMQTFPGKEMTNLYFEKCFRSGFGEGAESYSFRYRDKIMVDNKSEVAIGLADENVLIYDKNVRFESDIFGEKNIGFNQNGQITEFSEDDIIYSEYFEKLGQFRFPEKMENFEKFLRIFVDFIGHETGLVRNIAALENGSKDLHQLLGSFIANDSEYRKAIEAQKRTNKFEYRFPILIAEGLCYLEKVLIPEIFKS